MANGFWEGSVLALPKNFGASGDAPSSQNPFHQSSIASRCHLRFTHYALRHEFVRGLRPSYQLFANRYSLIAAVL
jgi:hypothetical protein